MQEIFKWWAVLGGAALILLYAAKLVVDHYFGRKRDLIDELVRLQQKDGKNG